MSKRTKYLFVVFAILLAINLFATGCKISREGGELQIRLNPKVANNIEKGGEGALSLLTLLSPFLGPAGGIAIGAVTTGLAVFKKIKPKLTEAQNKYELSNTVAGITVEAIEQIKIDNPKLWVLMAEKLRQECEDSGVDTKIVKNAIRGLRGLPAKT